MKVVIDKTKALKIVGDAGIATSAVGEGRFIVLLIIDPDGRTDIEDLFKVHLTTESGEIDVRWTTSLFSKNTIELSILFKSPLEVKLSIEFDIEKQGILVENIMNSKAVYLQLGKKGDRFIHDVNKQKILIEVPDTGAKNRWRSLWKKSLENMFKAKGYNRSESQELALNTMKEINKLKNLKIL